MSLPLFTDLFAVADRLEFDPRFNRLRPTLKKAARMSSCVNDLRQSLACFEALQASFGAALPEQNPNDWIIPDALLNQTIILYARATSTNGKGGERGPTGIAEQLDADQLKDHETLLLLRNRVIAHVYPGQVVSGKVWREEKVFLVKNQFGITPLAGTKRISFDPHIFYVIARQIPFALQIVKLRLDEELDKAFQIINNTDIPFGILSQCLVNPVDFYGSEDAVLGILSGMDAGFGAGIISGFAGAVHSE